ncbi:hypothetical protein [Streptomyces nigra]|uniref:hypothetical protein n=1 Tax=Streptomyces nigra TaxID=1827580 RepID=UPI000D529EC9|nr:hypothetical protein [Streptomyces nigra]AWE53307.1 hypothetical protein DC008_28910 [Streptomyces nigra]
MRPIPVESRDSTGFVVSERFRAAPVTHPRDEAFRLGGLGPARVTVTEFLALVGIPEITAVLVDDVLDEARRPLNSIAPP